MNVIPEKMIDPNVLTDLKKMAGEHYIQVLEAQLLDVEEQAEMLQLAFQNRQKNQLIVAAHTIKGSVCNFGAEPLVKLAKEVEQCAKQEDINTACNLVPQVLDMLTDVKTEVQLLLS